MLNEEQIIRLFFEEGKLPVDDCAYLPASSQIVTGDSMVEGTHFRTEWHRPDLLARKLFQSNLSDIAAGGGEPEWCLLQIGLPPLKSTDEEEYVKEFARAFRRECERHRCELIGGDTYRSAAFIFSLTMAGRTERPLQRRAQAGDTIYLTGTVGLSLIGLQHLSGERTLTGDVLHRALDRHLAPMARIDYARILRIHPQVHGMMDVSDGLVQDLERFARAAGLSFHLHLDDIPRDPDVALILSPEECAVSGEEYELLFCAPPGLQLDLPLSPIGRVTAGRAGLVVFQSRRETQPMLLPGRGFEHFR